MHSFPSRDTRGLKVSARRTQVVPFALGVLVDVFFGKAGEEDTVEAGVESVEVGATHVADT